MYINSISTSFNNIEKIHKPYFKVLSIIFVCLLLQFCEHQLSGQSYTIQFEHINSNSGLKQKEVNCIIQDKKGFIWIGTQEGLLRYDGYEFVHYQHIANNRNSLSNNKIWCLLEDTAGCIWVGTQGGGLNCYDSHSNKFTNFQHDANNQATISSNLISTLFQDSRGDLWIGTVGGGLNLFDKEKKLFTNFKYEVQNANSLTNNTVRAIAEDPDGNIWIGTSGGLDKFVRDSLLFVHYRNLEKATNSFTDNDIRVLTMQNNKLWIGTKNGGLIYYNFENQSFNYKEILFSPAKKPSNLDIRCLLANENELWIGTFGNGIFRISDIETADFKAIAYKNNITDPSSISNDFIVTALRDKSGSIWFGTFGGGINIYDSKGIKFIRHQYNPLITNGLNTASVRAIYQDSAGIVWLGTSGGGLNKFNRENRQFTHFQNDESNPASISNNFVNTILGIDHNKLWVGTYGGGLNIFNTETEQFSTNHPLCKILKERKIFDIYSLARDSKNRIWIGTRGSGLLCYYIENKMVKVYKHSTTNPESLSCDFIRTIFEDSKGRIWVGTRGGGLCLFNENSETFTTYLPDSTCKNCISSNIIMCIAEDKHRQLWIGTSGGGINMFDVENELFTVYNTTNGLANNTVFGILIDNTGILWISTNNGLSRFDSKTIEFQNFTVNDGLQGNEFNSGAAFKSSTGELFFGGTNGINTFFPEMISKNMFYPTVVVTGFQIFNKEIVPAENSILKQNITETKLIELDYSHSVFSFKFSALSFTQSEKNKYAFMLEGYDSDWRYVGNQRSTTYTNLDPGSYIFKVKAANNDNLWNETPTEIKIIINPPFWKTLWFKIVVTVFVLISIYSFYINRINRIKRQNQQLEEQVWARTTEIVKQKEAIEIQNKKLQTQKEEIELQAARLEITNKELEKLSLALKETGNAVMILDIEGNIEWVNDGFTRMYGYSFRDFLEERGRNICDISSNKKIIQKISNCIIKRTTIRYEALNNHISGKALWTQTALTPIIGNNNKVIGMVAIDTDIQEIKSAHDEITRQKNKIEAQRDQLQEANATKDKLFSIIGHDLKNPFSVITTLASIADENYNDFEDNELRETIKTIHKASKQGLNLLDDLLLWAKAKTGRIQYSPDIFDLYRIVIECFIAVEAAAQKKQIRLISNITEKTEVFADANMISTVIRNLLANAIKFTMPKGIIEIAAQKNKHFIEVKIIDNGIGIKEENIDKLFRIDVSFSTKGTMNETGTGLGLSLCKEFVEKNGGKIWVESQYKKGSTFIFSIPAMPANEEMNLRIIEKYSELINLLHQEKEDSNKFGEELKTYLNEDLKMLHLETNRLMTMETVSAFAAQVLETGQKFEINTFVEYANLLKQQAEQHQIGEIIVTLSLFASLTEIILEKK